jgi:hypothetical protein
VTIETNVQQALAYIDTAMDAAVAARAYADIAYTVARTTDQIVGAEYAWALAKTRVRDLETIRKLLLTGGGRQITPGL